MKARDEETVGKVFSRDHILVGPHRRSGIVYVHFDRIIPFLYLNSFTLATVRCTPVVICSVELAVTIDVLSYQFLKLVFDVCGKFIYAQTVILRVISIICGGARRRSVWIARRRRCRNSK